MEIKELRKKKRMTQKEFGEYFGIPLRTIQKWEQHDSEPLTYLISLIQDDIEDEDFCDVSKYLRKPQKTFRITNSKKYMNNERIHPIQQKRVQDIIESIKEYAEVEKIYIFGSSVEERCTYESDIDVYVELTKDINVKNYNVDVPVDFWTNFNVDNEMLKEIKSKGVIVYAR